MSVKKTEYQVQADFIRYLDLMYPDLLYTISPAGFIMSPGMARKMICMGYRKGTPDVLIFEPRASWHGFLMEIKTLGGETSEFQDAFLAGALARGYYTAVCFSTESAIKSVETYLKQGEQKCGTS